MQIPINLHAGLDGLEGGASGVYYHLSAADYAKIANWDAAYTHVSNDGSDHSFIDQDVKVAASPMFDELTLGDYSDDTDLLIAAGNNMNARLLLRALNTNYGFTIDYNEAVTSLGFRHHNNSAAGVLAMLIKRDDGEIRVPVDGVSGGLGCLSFGAAADARVWFDGSALNIVANVITAIDDLNLTAEYINIDGILDWSSATHAKPKIYSQAGEPGIANDGYAFWTDTDNGKYYLILDIDGAQKKVELV